MNLDRGFIARKWLLLKRSHFGWVTRESNPEPNEWVFPPNRTCTFQRIRLTESLCNKDSCTPSPCLRHYSEHLSIMGTPSPCVLQRLGDPQVTHSLWSAGRFPLC